MSSHHEIITQLQHHIDAVLNPLLKDVTQCALVDFPEYSNVGDSAIWLGQLAYLKKRGIHIRYYSTHANFSESQCRNALPDGPILICGGGNFGDIWHKHQEFRKYLLSTFTDRPIIQMPQSIHFTNPENIKDTAQCINAHPNFTLLLRDHPSIELAQTHFTCNVQLCPDMAFCLGPQTAASTHKYPLLFMSRTDSEKNALGAVPHTLPKGTSVQDWVEEPRETWVTLKNTAIVKLPTLGLKALNAQERRGLRYRVFAQGRFMRGLKQLNLAPYIITDRLHVHILATLMATPHTVLDNSYGKIGNFMRAFTHTVPHVAQAESVEAAVEIYKSYKSGT